MARIRQSRDNEVIGSMTFKQDYQSFDKQWSCIGGQTVNISKAMLSPNGRAYYKVFGTRIWVTNEDVTVNHVQHAQRRVYQSVL